jgi:hypothetical protein
MTTTTTTKSRQLPWLRYSEEVDRQIAAHTTAAQIDSYVSRAVSGAQTYRDAGTNEDYTVDYGGERSYSVNPPRPAAKTVNGASPKQKDLIDKLLGEKVHTYTETDVEAAKDDWRLTRTMIDTLLAAPRRPWEPKVEVQAEVAPAAPVRARLDFSSIPDGNYAVRVDGVVKFYRVSTGRNGYKNVQVRASDELFMKFGKAGIAILHQIVEAGLVESQMLYANELGRCWRCGKTLTDEVSRDRGMGPDCYAK